MIIHAYPKFYLRHAQAALGDAFDYAINTCGITGRDFIQMFVVSSVSKRMENGEPAYLVGKSGIEIALEVVAETKGQELQTEPTERMDRSAEYWIGWAVAYYQWYCGKPFSMILPKLRYQSLRNLYGVLHESDPSKAASVFDEFLSEQAETNLARYRKVRGFSQSQLANASGLSLRSIQLYEQRQNDINNAQYNRLQALAKTLGCKIEDLLE